MAKSHKFSFVISLKSGEIIQQLMSASMIETIRQAGVVGQGGAGFPTHVKLGGKFEWLIVNGAECEPLLYSDQCLMEKYPQQLVATLSLLKKQLGIPRMTFALKEKYHQAVQAIQREINRRKAELEVFLLGSFYPAGDEHILVYDVTGRTTPPGGIPLNIGVVTCNVETLLNIGRALEGQPVTDTYLTIGGEVEQPVTVCVPVGTLIRDLLQVVGGIRRGGYSILDGGPMMGFIRDMNDGVTKLTKGILLLPKTHRLIASRELTLEQMRTIGQSSCDDCKRCTDACPRYLIGHPLRPHLVMAQLPLLGRGYHPIFEEAQLCCECGVCELWACPCELSPRTVNVWIRRNLKRQGEPFQPLPWGVHPWYIQRKIPVHALKERLAIAQYDRFAPLKEIESPIRRVKIALKQHVGSAAKPLVRSGERVSRGQLIAEPAPGQLGASLHASIDGTIRGVTRDSIEIVK